MAENRINKLLGFNGWLSRNIVKDKSDVVVYFSGHGIANSKDNSTGILPFDVDPNYAIGLALKELYYNLSKMGAKTVTVYLDACFTGQTRDSKMLIADARPILISQNIICGSIREYCHSARKLANKTARFVIFSQRACLPRQSKT